MAERPSANVPCLEMAYVLFMDVVAYSTLAMDLQRRILRKLQETVSATTEFTRSKAADRLINLPTGDGMALVFFHDPEAPVRCALEISRGIRQHPDIKLRMGIHMGPVYRVADINANRNVAGGGINIAQRVMDCGDAGHILVSSAQAEVLSQISNWSSMLHDIGEAGVKHGVRVHLYNLYSDDAGNAATPQKAHPKPAAEASGTGAVTATPAQDEFEKQLAAQIASVRRKPLRRYFAIGVLIIALAAFVLLFWPSLFNTGPSRLRAQQHPWAVLINDAFTRNQTGQSGFRAHLHEPKEGPDILTTAQSLTALLVQPSATDYQANIDDAFGFIEARRLTSPYPGWSPLDADMIVRPNGESSAWIAVAKGYAIKSPLPRNSKAVVIARSTLPRDLALLASLQNSDGSWSSIAALLQKARPVPTRRPFLSGPSLLPSTPATRTWTRKPTPLRTTRSSTKAWSGF